MRNGVSACACHDDPSGGEAYQRGSAGVGLHRLGDNGRAAKEEDARLYCAKLRLSHLQPSGTPWCAQGSVQSAASFLRTYIYTRARAHARTRYQQCTIQLIMLRSYLPYSSPPTSTEASASASVASVSSAAAIGMAPSIATASPSTSPVGHPPRGRLVVPQARTAAVILRRGAAQERASSAAQGAAARDTDPVR